jgi:hypothetical protein
MILFGGITIMSIPTGVYIGKDIEIVITDKYTLVYRRNNEKQFLESALLFTGTNICISICRAEPSDGICRSEACKSKKDFVPNTWRYAFNHDNAFSSDNEMLGFLGEQFISMTINGNLLEAKFYDDTYISAEAAEMFSEKEITPNCCFAFKDNIAKCLQDWILGCHEIIENNMLVGVEVNTFKHMYIYELKPEFIYCRAARYIACEKGIVFNQNFRQRFEAYMLADNREAMNKLEYDQGLFGSDSCVWNNRSVYWSVSSVQDDLITLNGCQGDTYKWKKPSITLIRD